MANLYAALVLLYIGLLGRNLLISSVLSSEAFGLLDAIPKGSIDVARLGRCIVAGHVDWVSRMSLKMCFMRFICVVVARCVLLTSREPLLSIRPEHCGETTLSGW